MKTHRCQNLLALGVRDGVTTSEVVANGYVHEYQVSINKTCYENAKRKGISHC